MSGTSTVLMGDRGRVVIPAGVRERMGLKAATPVTPADAEVAAYLWPAHKNLSLGDRSCLALADRLKAEAWTADRAWDDVGSSHLIR